MMNSYWWGFPVIASAARRSKNLGCHRTRFVRLHSDNVAGHFHCPATEGGLVKRQDWLARREAAKIDSRLTGGVMTERVLVVGKGAREHALAYRLSRDPSDKVIRDVLICPGNDGTAFTQACMRPAVEGFAGIAGIAKKLRPSLIVIGPEEPLAHGLADALSYEGFSVFGPTQKATQIESSKAFMKELATNAQIPTAAYKVFSDMQLALEYCDAAKYPLVVKADGLCAGKGVVVAQTPDEARAAVKQLLQGSIVLEEFLSGVEMSVIALCTGDDAFLFAPVRDHKRLLENDQGPNTGGMGAVGPLPELLMPGFMSKKESSQCHAESSQ